MANILLLRNKVAATSCMQLATVQFFNIHGQVVHGEIFVVHLVVQQKLPRVCWYYMCSGR